MPNIIYIVQDESSYIRGVYYKLEDAFETWIIVVKEIGEKPEFAYLKKEYGDDWLEELENLPCIEVWNVNEGYVNTYYYYEEIEEEINNNSLDDSNYLE